MLGLPETTEVRQFISKAAIYRKFELNHSQQTSFDEDIKKSRAAGMDAHLSKPIQVTVMLKTISYFIREGRKSEKQWNTNS